MARTYSGVRIVNALQIPSREFALIHEGVIAVHPKWLPAVRALVVAQPQLARWLDRGLLATQHMINWRGEHGWIIHKPGLAGSLTTGYLGSGPSADADEFTSSQIHPSVDLPQLRYATSDSPFAVYSSIMRSDTRQYPAGAPVSYSVFAKQSAGVPIGPQVKFMGAGSPSYPFSGMDDGVRSYHSYRDVWWPAPAEIVAPIPEPTVVDWPLISGPAVCSRGELWPRLGVKWFAASYQDIAAAIEVASIGLKGTEKTKATQQVEVLRSRPLSAVYYILLGDHVNAWGLFPPTMPDSDSLRRKTAVENDIDFGAINAFLTESRDTPFVSVVLGNESIISGTPIVDVFPTDGVIVMEPTGHVTWEGKLLPTTTTDLPAYCSWIRARGSHVTLVTYDGGLAELAKLVKEANEVLSTHADTGAFHSDTADHGGVGLAALTAGMGRLSDAKQGMLRAIIQPSYLDWAIEHTQIV